MPDFFSEGNTPRREDPRWRILQKILGATIAGGGGGGGNFRAGSGAPVGAAPGALRTAYADDDTGVIYVQNLDGTWPTLP